MLPASMAFVTTPAQLTSTSSIIEASILESVSTGAASNPLIQVTAGDSSKVPAEAVQIIDFSPKSEFIYGLSNLTLKLANFPSYMNFQDLSADFKSHGISPCVFIEFSAAVTPIQNYSTCCHSVRFHIPRAFFTESFMPSIILTINNSTVSINFPSNFTYLEPPQPLIGKVTPTVVSIAKSTIITVVVTNFPPVSLLGDIVVACMWASPNKTTRAVVNGVYIFNQSSNDILINISSPTGTKSRAGRAIIAIHHSLYPHFKVTFEGLVFQDLSRPKITKLQLAGTSSGLNSIRISINNQQPVFISFEDVPANFEDIECTARIGGEQVNITSSIFNPASMSAIVALTTGQAMSAGFQTGIFIFGKQFATPECDSACCVQDSCSAEYPCAHFKTTCFQLEYFDDTLPFVINRPKTSG
jgi:hypothetical protein